MVGNKISGYPLRTTISMKRTANIDLNKLSTGWSPCFNEVKNIKKKIHSRTLSEVKIEEIKEIVNSLFEDKK